MPAFSTDVSMHLFFVSITLKKDFPLNFKKADWLELTDVSRMNEYTSSPSSHSHKSPKIA